MATERNMPDVVERLNALIDGELPPAEHARLADRIAVERELAHGHATLARLKAALVETAVPMKAVELPVRRTVPRRSHIVAAGMAASIALAVIVWWPQASPDEPLNAEIGPVITLAALPAAPVIPDLAHAGLVLVGGEVERSGGTPVLVASYRGPRGCRLELRVRPVFAAVQPTAGTSRRVWQSGDLAYELVAFGMPAGRFEVVAAAAETATRDGRMPQDAGGRLREASLLAPPCLG
jgi:anti-sigma factor RsiW